MKAQSCSVLGMKSEAETYYLQGSLPWLVSSEHVSFDHVPQIGAATACAPLTFHLAGQSISLIYRNRIKALKIKNYIGYCYQNFHHNQNNLIHPR